MHGAGRRFQQDIEAAFNAHHAGIVLRAAIVVLAITALLLLALVRP